MSKELDALMRINQKFVQKEWNNKPRETEKDFELIENALKNYEELTNKPVMLYGRNHKKTQALIDTICKNYKEVKITNLEDEKKLKALKIIKEKEVDVGWFNRATSLYHYNMGMGIKSYGALSQEEYDLLKEVLL